MAEARALKKLASAPGDKYESFPGVDMWAGSRDHLQRYTDTLDLVMGQERGVTFRWPPIASARGARAPGRA